MHDRPIASELLAAIADLLEREVTPAVGGGGLEYRVRVAVNLSRILEREARLGPAALAREQALLETLVGPTDDLLALNTRLVARLRSGDVDRDFEKRALAALHEIARAKLAIARPGYERYDSGIDA